MNRSLASYEWRLSRLLRVRNSPGYNTLNEFGQRVVDILVMGFDSDAGITITQAEIGELVGVRRQCVNRTMGEIVDAGVFDKEVLGRPGRHGGRKALRYTLA